MSTRRKWIWVAAVAAVVMAVIVLRATGIFSKEAHVSFQPVRPLPNSYATKLAFVLKSEDPFIIIAPSEVELRLRNGMKTNSPGPLELTRIETQHRSEIPIPWDAVAVRVHQTLMSLSKGQAAMFEPSIRKYFSQWLWKINIHGKPREISSPWLVLTNGDWKCLGPDYTP